MTLSKASIFDLLRAEYRRAVLRYLDANGDAASLDEMVSALQREVDGDGPFHPADRMAVKLHQIHLPKLAQADVVEYDHSERTARLLAGNGPLFEYLYFDPGTA